MISKIKDILTWYSDKQEICDFVEKINKENINLQKELNRKNDLLVLFPNVRGRRFSDIIVPEWVQFENKEQLGIDLANYLSQEVYPTKRLRQ